MADKFKNKAKKSEIVDAIKETLYLETASAEAIYNYFRGTA